MKPLRRKKNYEVTQDPKTGLDRILNLIEEEDILSDQGSVDSTRVHYKSFLDCECDSEIGGRCFECGAVSCKTCHGRCNSCQKPICLEHSSFLQVGGEDRIRLCRRCYDSIIRKQKLARVGRIFLSLFIDEDKNE